jgi:GntR family transcriptional regulator/MocR family aminotransferase
VLYVGTFSKTMFPSLRLGFLVLPAQLVAEVQSPLEEMLRGGHRCEQLAMADFIESGQFSRHLGRMRGCTAAASRRCAWRCTST